MNKRGDLKFQFLAWIQLQKKTQIETGEIAEALGLTAVQERKLLSRLCQQGLIVRLRRGLYMVPQKVPPGGKWTPGEYALVRSLMEDVEAEYQIGGPVAFQQYGFDTQVPNEVTVYNDMLSKRSTIAGLRFVFIKVSSERLGGVENLKLPGGGSVKIATLARTLMDAVYDWKRFNTLPRALSWIVSKKKETDTIEELIRLTIKHGNVSTMRRIGYTLDSCKVSSNLLLKLQTKSTSGKSLVTLLPKLPARGEIQRDWGIIDNRKS